VTLQKWCDSHYLAQTNKKKKCGVHKYMQNSVTTGEELRKVRHCHLSNLSVLIYCNNKLNVWMTLKLLSTAGALICTPDPWLFQLHLVQSIHPARIFSASLEQYP
jgi:hypothetical protein